MEVPSYLVKQMTEMFMVQLMKWTSYSDSSSGLLLKPFILWNTHRVVGALSYMEAHNRQHDMFVLGYKGHLDKDKDVTLSLTLSKLSTTSISLGLLIYQ